MKKMVLMIIALTLVVGASAGCSSTTRTEVIPLNSTVVTSNAEEAAKCAVLDGAITAKWRELQGPVVVNATSEKEAERKSAQKVLKEGRENLIAARNWVANCGDYFPAKVVEYNNTIAWVTKALDEFESKNKVKAS